MGKKFVGNPFCQFTKIFTSRSTLPVPCWNHKSSFQKLPSSHQVSYSLNMCAIAGVWGFHPSRTALSTFFLCFSTSVLLYLNAERCFTKTSKSSWSNSSLSFGFRPSIMLLSQYLNTCANQWQITFELCMYITMHLATAMPKWVRTIKRLYAKVVQS